MKIIYIYIYIYLYENKRKTNVKEFKELRKKVEKFLNFCKPKCKSKIRLKIRNQEKKKSFEIETFCRDRKKS